MEGAHGVLLSIYGGSDLGLFEINDAATLVAESAHADANIIFGAVIDDTLGDEVKVTVIAAGFDSGQLPYKKLDARPEGIATPGSTAGTSATTGATTGATGQTGLSGGSSSSTQSGPATSSGPQAGAASAPSTRPSPVAANAGGTWTPSTITRKPVSVDDEELDVPDFLK
jgi:cell division protein FtsZ